MFVASHERESGAPWKGTKSSVRKIKSVRHVSRMGVRSSVERNEILGVVRKRGLMHGGGGPGIDRQCFPPLARGYEQGSPGFYPARRPAAMATDHNSSLPTRARRQTVDDGHVRNAVIAVIERPSPQFRAEPPVSHGTLQRIFPSPSSQYCLSFTFINSP